ncbi:MAG: beta-galactosidase, partial [Victivallaceae bacterium]
TDFKCAEDISALAGMMDLNVKAVKFVYAYPFDSIFLFYDNQSILSNGDAAARMRQALTEKYDVIVLGPASVKQHIPADIQSSIVDQVSKGTGLIAVTPHDFTGQPLSKLLPVEASGKKIGDGRMAFKSGSALSGVPMTTMPPVFFQSLTVLPGAESMVVSGASPVIVRGTSGNGKVYVFGWLGIGENMIGKVDNNNAVTTLTPSLSRKGENKYWIGHLKRYHRLLLGQAILDVAGKTSRYSISPVTDEGGIPVLEINAPEAGRAELDCLVSAAEGLWQHRFLQTVSLEKGINRIKPEIKFGAPSGNALLDVVVRINGKAATCGGFGMNINNGVNISSISAADIWRQGGTETVTINFAGNVSGCRIKLTAADKNGRIGAEEVQNVSSSNATFQVDTSRLLSPFVRLTAELNGTDGKIKAVATLDRILLPSKRTDFNRFIHYTWGRGEDSFPMEYGLIGQHWHKTGNIGNCSNGTISIPYFWKFGSKLGYEDGSLKDKIINGKHIRGGSLSDPQFLAKTEQELTSRTITWKKYEPPVYILNDETRHSPSAHVYWEGDYHSASLEKFREWLKVRYVSLDKLNKEWDTAFTSWNAIQPMTLEEVKKRGTRNFAPWADFRDFNDDAFAKYVKFCADTIKKNDPAIRTGMSGTESPYVSSGWDWWKMSGAMGTVWSYDGIQVELLRSFAPYRDIVVNNYSIGYGWHGPELFYLMFRSMLNQSHGLASWRADIFYTPEGSLSLAGRDTKRITDLFSTGLWQYTRSFKREKNVAVLYSMSSVRAAFAEGKYERYRDSVQGWVNLLYDCCISWSFIAEEQLDKGILEQEKYQAVVLPATMAISDAGIAA